MNIHLFDHSSGKIYFAARFLHYLSECRHQVTFFDPKESLKTKADFLSLFPGIVLMSGQNTVEQPDLIIDFRTHLRENETGTATATLQFMITDERSIPGKLPRSVIPVSENPVMGGVYVSDYDAAVDYTERSLGPGDFSGERILISAGPTAEDIDPVRFITNRSTGKMGLAMARAAFRRGAEVMLVMGPAPAPMPVHLNGVRVRSAAEMTEAILKRFEHCDLYIGSAAVADYTPNRYSESKLKKADGELSLALKRTTDILQSLREIKKKQMVIGFSVETDNEIDNSIKKLKQKNLDLIAVNNPRKKGAAFEADTNLLTLIGRDGNIRELPLMSKIAAGNAILDEIKAIKNK